MQNVVRFYVNQYSKGISWKNDTDIESTHLLKLFCFEHARNYFLPRNKQ